MHKDTKNSPVRCSVSTDHARNGAQSSALLGRPGDTAAPHDPRLSYAGNRAQWLRGDSAGADIALRSLKAITHRYFTLNALFHSGRKMCREAGIFPTDGVST